MMPHCASSVLAFALLTVLCGGDALAAKKTVCTITVNSADEKEMFEQRLPRDKFQFVELVEHGRPDWLAAACRKGIQCDVLIVSGHFAGTDFFSEQIDTQEFLPVEEMERVSCSDSCPGLFSKLKEVYLFGCNTLNAEPVATGAAGIARGAADPVRARAGDGPATLAASAAHGETSRDRMRRIFSDVPVIYGFSAKAPVGKAAAGILGRYFQTATAAEIGSGRISGKLLGQFAGSSMAAASGIRDTDREARYRDEVCQFYDERLEPAQKLDFVHQLLRRNAADVRTFFDRIEKFTGALDEEERATPALRDGLDAIARDDAAREHYLALVRDTDGPPIRARMVKLAGTLGWLTPDAERAELVRVVGDVLAANRMGPAEVDFVCTLNAGHELDGELDRFALTPAQETRVTHNAALACLGSTAARERVLQGLAGADAQGIEVAQVYFRHHPITDAAELRAIAMAIGPMSSQEAKVRLLDLLAHQYVADRQSLDELVRLFSLSQSVEVQRAIAGILIRSDWKLIAKPAVIRTLSEHRVRSPDGLDVIDALIRRLRA